MRKLLFLIPLFAVLLTACSKPEHYKAIPKDAPVVFMVNTPGIIKKVALNSIGNLSETWALFQDTAKATTNFGKLMKSSDAAGIDTKEEIYGWLSYDEFSLTPMPSFCFSVDDQSKLAFYVTDTLGIKINVIGNYQTAELDRTSLLAWNEHSALLMFGRIENLKESLLDLPEEGDTSISDVDGFKKMREAGHDVSMWVRSDYLKEVPAGFGILAKVNGHLFADFNNGQVSFSFEQTVKDKELQAYSGTLNNKSSFNDFSSFSQDKLLGALAGSVNLSSDFISKNKDSLNNRVTPYGVTADDIYKSFSGDFMVGVQGVKTTQEITIRTEQDEDFNNIQISDTVKHSIPLITTVLKLKDEKTAVIVLDKIAEKLGFMLTNGQYVSQFMGEAVHVYIKNGQLVLSNDENVWGEKSGKVALSKEAQASLQQPLALYLNYQLIHKSDLGKFDPSRHYDSTTEEFASQMDFMTISIAETQPNLYNFKLDLYMLNKEENILIQIMKHSRKKSKDSTPVTKANV